MNAQMKMGIVLPTMIRIIYGAKRMVLLKKQANEKRAIRKWQAECNFFNEKLKWIIEN